MSNLNKLIKKYHYNFNVEGIIFDDVIATTSRTADLSTFGLCPSLLEDVKHYKDATLTGVPSEYGIAKALRKKEEKNQIKGINTLTETPSANIFNLYDGFDEFWKIAYFKELITKENEQRIKIELKDAINPNNLQKDGKRIVIYYNGNRSRDTIIKFPIHKCNGGKYKLYKYIWNSSDCFEDIGNPDYNFSKPEYRIKLFDSNLKCENFKDKRMIISRVDISILNPFNINGQKIYIGSGFNSEFNDIDRIFGYFETSTSIIYNVQFNYLNDMCEKGYQEIISDEEIWIKISKNINFNQGQFELAIYFDLI